MTIPARFIFIDDIVNGILACFDRSHSDDGSIKPDGSVSPHAIYNIGNNRSEPQMKVVGVMEEVLGRKADIGMLLMQQGDVPRTFAEIDGIACAAGYRRHSRRKKDCRALCAGGYHGLI